MGALSDRLVVGILGAGRMAQGFDDPGSPHVLSLAHAVQASRGFSLGGFFDQRPERAEAAERRWSCPPSPRARAAWLSQPWDVVLIATPDTASFVNVAADRYYVWEMHVWCERGKIELSRSPEVLELSGLDGHPLYSSFQVLTPRERFQMEREPVLVRLLETLADAIADPDAARTLLRREIDSQAFSAEGRDTYDVRGRTAHESIFNVNDGNYRCPNSQQGYSPFSTWTRGLAWAMLGFAEQLEFFDTLEGHDETRETLALLWRIFRTSYGRSAKVHVSSAGRPRSPERSPGPRYPAGTHYPDLYGDTSGPRSAP